jgi:hypothetical protein
MAEVAALTQTLDRILKLTEAALPKRIDEIIQTEATSIVAGIKKSLETEASIVGKEMLEDFKKKLREDLYSTNMKQIEDIFANNINDVLKKMAQQKFDAVVVEPVVGATNQDRLSEGGYQKNKKSRQPRRVKRNRRTKKSYFRHL